MTVETTSVFAGPYPTDGIATAFPFAFKALSPREVRVEINGNVVSDSLYGVQIAAQSGAIVFLTAPTSGGTLYVLSDPDFRQGISFSNQSAFLPTSHNEANDRAAVRDQVLAEGLVRAIQLPLGEDASVLPAAGDRASAVLAFDASGQVITKPIGSFPEGPEGKPGEVSFAFLKGTLGSRSANVLDIGDWDATGVHDNAAGYQLLINQAATAGVGVDMPAGKALLGGTIVLPDGHIFNGKGGATLFANPARASTFYLAHSGKGFTRSGGGGANISINNQATVRNQPEPVQGWVPNDHDYDYYFEDISDLRMNKIFTTNATRGIYFNGGRNHIVDWSGQCFNTGLHIDWSYDTCILDNVHLWPFWSQHPQVKAYSQDHLHSFELRRVDNPFFSRIFSIWHQAAFDIGFFPGDGPNKPSGTTSKLKLSQADLDIGDVGYMVRPEAGGHTAKFESVTMQARDEVIASALLQIDGPNTRIDGDIALSGSGGNGVRMGATSTGSEVALRTTINDWNRTGVGFPAVEVETGGGHYQALPGSHFVNGNGAPVSAGNVTVWAP